MKQCSTKTGCGQWFDDREFLSPKSHKRRQCQKCAKAYSDKQKDGRKKKSRGKAIDTTTPFYGFTSKLRATSGYQQLIESNLERLL